MKNLKIREHNKKRITEMRSLSIIVASLSKIVFIQCIGSILQSGEGFVPGQ